MKKKKTLKAAGAGLYILERRRRIKKEGEQFVHVILENCVSKQDLLCWSFYVTAPILKSNLHHIVMKNERPGTYTSCLYFSSFFSLSLSPLLMRKPSEYSHDEVAHYRWGLAGLPPVRALIPLLIPAEDFFSGACCPWTNGCGFT